MSLQNKLMSVGQPSAMAQQTAGDVAATAVATGTTQADALPLSCAYNYVTTVNSGTGVRLYGQSARPSSIGDEQTVYNAGANALNVYPPAGEQILGVIANAAFSIPTSSKLTFKKVTNTLWVASETFVQSGSAAVSRSVQDKDRERFTPEDNGLIGDGTTTITAADMKQLFANAIAAGRPVDLTGKTYLLSTAMTLDSNYSNLRILGGTLKKGFNGDLLTLSNCASFSAYGTTFEGQHGTFTGKGVVFSGSSSNYPVFMGCLFSQFTDTDLEFGADAGHSAELIGCRSRLGSGQTDPRVIHVNGPDTGARIRRVVGCSFEGYIQADGAQDLYVTASQFTRIVPNSAVDALFVTSCRWGNGGTAMTLSGNCLIAGCSFAGNVTLDSNYSGTFVGNIQSTGTFTNSTAGGNATVLHHAPGDNFIKIGHAHELDIQASSAFQIPARALVSPGDADLTFTPGASGPDIVYATTLTANRTVTLSTTGAKNGMVATISRPAGDTLGPWTVAVGATGTTLATKTWCEVIYTGSFWRVLKYGTLP